ncbi:MAG: DUF2934 domain-containing protein [Nitrospirota bacterium]
MARSIFKGANKESRTTEENGPGTAASSQADFQENKSLGFPHSQDWEPASRGAMRGEFEETQEGHLHRRIAQRAFQLYEESGFRHGNDVEHWLEAERQVHMLGV